MPTSGSRAVLRLLAFSLASMSLHAALFGGLGAPGATVRAQRPTPQPPLLHAVLAPDAASPPAEGGAASAGAGPVEASDFAASGDPGATAGKGLVAPDRWYEASEVDVRAEPADSVELAYPEHLEGSGIVGRVRMLLFIDEHGVVIRTRIVASQPPRVFDAAARDGWQGVRFTPALKHGIAVKSRKLLELDFEP